MDEALFNRKMKILKASTLDPKDPDYLAKVNAEIEAVISAEDAIERTKPKENETLAQTKKRIQKQIDAERLGNIK